PVTARSCPTRRSPDLDRTIRVALWSGEEQGLVGSQAHVARHYARWPEPTDPAQQALPASLREPTGPLRTTRDYERFSVYFNMDKDRKSTRLHSSHVKN